MTIKSNSLIAYYYKWMFRGDLANDFCTLFWNTLFSFLLLPLTLPAFIASLVFGHDIWDRNLLSKSFRGLLTYFGLFFAFCFGIGAFQEVFGNVWTTWGFWKIMGASLLGLVGLVLTIVLVIGSIAGICAGAYYSYMGIKKSLSKKVVYKTYGENGKEYEDHYYEPKEYKVVVVWNTIRNKYCTKITWK